MELMKLYKYDMHVHTAEVSICGMVPASQVVYLYKEAGYHGIVITDHYIDEYFYGLGHKSWKDKIDEFLKGYRNALSEGEKSGLKIIPGIEIRFTENNNDYLIYGIDEAFLRHNKELYKLGLEKFRKLIRGENILIYQAHPFRSWVNPANPVLLDGVEVFNGNLRQVNNNHQALSFAVANNLKMASGSDFHQVEDLAMGGVIFPDEICTPVQLFKALKNDRAVGLIGSDFSTDTDFQNTR